MGIDYVQEYIEKACEEACKTVDLLNIARGCLTRRPGRGPNHLRLVIDAESCLDRLYGGFYSDWACGGQWNRMLNFVGTFLRACDSANIELLVMFNGAFEEQYMDEWCRNQSEVRNNVRQVLRHIHNKATPPPKVWWVAPSCLRIGLRYALRQMGVPVACSLQDHRLEVITHCREQGFLGLLANDSTYAMFDPPRYFDSNFKLTYKGSLETKEFVMDDVARLMDLNPNRFPVMAALLGNHILTENDLRDFHLTICKTSPKNLVFYKKALTEAVIDFVRSLQSTDDLDVVAAEVFKNTAIDQEKKKELFKKSCRYYYSGTFEGYNKLKPIFTIPQVQPTRPPNAYKKPSQNKAATAVSTKTNPAETSNTDKTDTTHTDKDDTLANSAYTEAASGYGASSDNKETDGAAVAGTNSDATKGAPVHALVTGIAEKLRIQDDATEGDGEETTGSSITSKDICPGSHPSRIQSLNPSASQGNKQDSANTHQPPTVTPEVMRIATERHLKGLMSHWVYQVLTKGEIKFDVSLEDESGQFLPSAIDLFRPLRQRVYAVLFDLNKKRLIAKSDPKQLPEGALDITIREWSVNPGDGHGGSGEGTAHVDVVPAEPLEWKVPSLHRLWLGQNVEDKNRRLRAFLSCLHSDTPILLDTTCVPQHLLVFACVLRYIVKTFPILRRHELDAFLATAVSPLLADVDTMQDMKLPMLTVRGVQLASLFMRGMETAIFANDACGAPIPWNCCCPWLCFDGKLFHFKLLKASNNTQLLEICDGHMDQVMKVEQLRNAIMDGIPPEHAFSRPPMMMNAGPGAGAGFFQQQQQHHHHHHHHPNLNLRPAGASQLGPGGNMGGPPMGMAANQHNMRGRGRGLLGRSPVDQRGGQLEIAGVVVGNWGANNPHGGPPPQGRGTHVAPPHVTSVGPNRSNRGNNRVIGSIANRGRGHVRAPIVGRQNNSKAQVPAHRFYHHGVQEGNGRSSHNRGQQRGGRGQGDLKYNMTLEQRNKEAGGRGRGCTIESSEGESCSLSQVVISGDMGPASLMANLEGLPTFDMNTGATSLLPDFTNGDLGMAAMANNQLPHQMNGSLAHHS